MKKGDFVEIYEDPLGETRKEGKAQLVKHLKGKGADGQIFSSKLEFWKVRFLDEPDRTFERLIKVELK